MPERPAAAEMPSPHGILDCPGACEWAAAGRGDFNGDGAADLVLEALGVAGEGERRYDVVAGPFPRTPPVGPDGRWRPEPTASIVVGGAQADDPLLVADVNSDGLDDLIVLSARRSGGQEHQVVAALLGDTGGLRDAQLQGDAGADIIVTRSRPLRTDEQGGRPSRLAASVGDLDGDGHADLVLSAAPIDYRGTIVQGRETDLVAMRGPLESGAFSDDLLLEGIGACYTGVVGVGDLTGDGRGDIASLFCDDRGLVTRVGVVPGAPDWPSSGPARLRAAWQLRVSWLGVDALTAYDITDANGDDQSDLVLSAEGVVHLWHGGPDFLRTQSLSRASRVIVGSVLGSYAYTAAWRAPDLDADGASDLLVARYDPEAARAERARAGTDLGQPLLAYRSVRGDEVLDTDDVVPDAEWHDPRLVLWAVADLDGDGIDDVVLAHPHGDRAYPYVLGPLL